MRLTLSASIGPYPHAESLLAGPFELKSGIRVEPQVGGTGDAARSMVRALGFDICETPMVNYLSAKEHGLQATALPIFVTRRYPQSMLAWNRSVGLSSPEDLIGRRIGMGYHGNTDVVWVRGMLSDRHGVSPDSVTWVKTQEEQVPEATLPSNVELREGARLEELLISGELAALVYGRGIPRDLDHVEPMYDDIDAAEQEWFEETGIFPILHAILVKDAVLADHPELPAQLFEAFLDAKQRALSRLDSGESLTAEQLAGARLSGFPLAKTSTSRRDYLGPDPLPFGLEPNRSNLEMLIRFAHEQHVIANRPRLEELFIPLEE